MVDERISRACIDMDLDAEITEQVRSAPAPRAAVRTLVDAGELGAALALAARLLPRRYLVAWACQCARFDQLDEEDRVGAALAEGWVRATDEPTRSAAAAFADAGGYRSIGTWLAASAGWSGGSLAPAELDCVPPPDHLSAVAALAALNMAAAKVPVELEQRRQRYLDQALTLLDDGSQR